jgi:hypothetical protein
MEAATVTAFADPAYLKCLGQAAANAEMVANFDRLAGTNLALRWSAIELAVDASSGRLDADLGRFADFVRDAIYDRLEPQAILALRGEA